MRFLLHFTGVQAAFHENPLFHFAPFKNCFQRTLCSDFRSRLLFLFYENRPAKIQFQMSPFSTTTRSEKSRTPPDRSATPYYVESFRCSAWVHRTKVQNMKSIVLNLDSKPIFWIDCRQHEQCSSPFMKTREATAWITRVELNKSLRVVEHSRG